MRAVWRLFLLLYRLTWRFFETAAVMTALMYVCAVAIAFDKTYSYNYKRLVIASVVMTCCMPIGSNVGITHICNESFFVMPMIFMLARDRLFGGGKPWKNMSTYIAAAFAVCMLAISVTQAFYRSASVKDNADMSTNTAIAQLKYIRSDRTESEALEELLSFIADGGYESAVAVGSIPVVNYLAKIKPGVDSCGGWIETDYVTAEDISRDLHKNMPLIIVSNSEFSDDTAKNRAIEEFIKEQNYVETFSDWKFTVYDKNDR